MRGSSASKWYLGAALASVLVLVAGWFLLVGPQRGTAEELNAEADAKIAANAATQQQIEDLKAQYKDLPALEQQLAAVRARIPNTPNMPSVIRNLSKNAASAGVKLAAFTPDEPQPLTQLAGEAEDYGLQDPGQVNAYGVTLNVTGRFANVRLFLSSLEQMQRSFLVTGVSIVRDDSGEATAGQLVAVVTGRVFTANPGFPEKKAPAAAPGAEGTETTTESTNASAS